jgi:ribosomal protein S18 acetylase RimI-like enzyme
MVVELVPMVDTDFRRYMETAVEDYAQSRFRCGDEAVEESRAAAKDAYEQLLSQGIASPGQHLFCIVAPGVQGRVGIVWLALREKYGVKSAYVYNIEVDEAHRGKGYGAGALARAEAFAREWGAVRLSLNVWNWNETARSLYEKAGFEVMAIGMTKVLVT